MDSMKHHTVIFQTFKRLDHLILFSLFYYAIGRILIIIFMQIMFV